MSDPASSSYHSSRRHHTPTAHYMHIVGYCNLQRPVIYSCLQMASNRVVEDNKAHMISTFERVGNVNFK